MARKKYKTPDEQLSMFEFDTPSMPVLDVSRCEARLINHETAARMVETYHYAHRVPSIVVAVGMYVDGVLAGCLTYGYPPAPEVQQCCGVSYQHNTLELNRLFVFDYVGKNGESWLIGQSFKTMPQNYYILVSYADTGHNHLGYIYQATNWIYTGETKPAKDVKIIGNSHSRSVRHIGTNKQILEMGIGEIEERTIKHRYVYFLGSKKQRKELRKALKWPVLPYPKRETT